MIKLKNLLKENWWDDLSDEAQQKYIDKHGSAPGVVQRNTVGGGDPSVTPHDPGEPEADVAGGDEDEPDYSPGHPDNMDDDELEPDEGDVEGANYIFPDDEEEIENGDDEDDDHLPGDRRDIAKCGERY